MTLGGADFKASNESEEQPAKLRPAAMTTITARMIHPPKITQPKLQSLAQDHMSVAAAMQPPEASTLSCG
jgi:hypothetical protein